MVKCFISFEGGEGSGKTTLIEMLVQDLGLLGYNIVKTREPGGSKIAEEIRNILLDLDNINLDYKTEALLYAASRRQHLVEVILPALNSGKIVICDRYVDSSLAYQGYARGLGIEEVYKINQYAIDDVLPNLTILIDVSPEIGLMRIKKNNRSVDRLDLEELSFHEKVREGYLELAKMFQDRIVVVDGNRPPREIYKDIKEIVLDIL